VTTFCDASAIVKRYVDEPGSGAVAELDERVVVSDLSAIEVPSAIWRKQRAGQLSPNDASLIVAAFGYDLRGGTYQPPRFATIGLHPAVLEHAVDLLPRHDLRSSDALQLACAVSARGSLEFCDTFMAFDHRLRIAAAAEGFVVAPAEHELEVL
jgi:predicted nucleic acid-binding protein